MSAPAWATAPGRPSLRAQRLVADGAVVLALAAWLAAARSGAPETIAPDPARVLPLTLELFTDPRLAPHTYASLARVLVAGAAAVVLGTALMLAARFVYLTRVLIAARVLPLLSAFPTVGWAILAVVWFGVSDAAVLAVMVAILLPFTMVNVWSGLLTLDEELYEMARSFGRDRLRRLRLIVLPALLPEIVSSARISYGIGWKVGIVAELFGVTTGLGYLMAYARTVFDTALLYAAILAVVIFAFAVDGIVFARLERLITRHRADTARATARA
ncbi:MAG TPA: ABC transporter permease subunit [Candidatus Limnocylindria bacterium]|nr:ABC transporter permease subunit [Candidatus Limnocylindria bacterium]